MFLCGASVLPQVVVPCHSQVQDEHRGVQLGTSSEECGNDQEEVGMDVLERIKAAYDKFKGNPSGLEDYVTRRLQEEAFRSSPLKVAVPKGTKVIFHWNAEGKIIDLEFDRIH